MDNKQQNLTYLCLTTPEQLTELEGEWEALNREVSGGSFFTSWYWLMTWVDTYLRPQDKLCVFCLHAEGKLVALAPFYLKKIRFGYELQLLGSGENQAAEVVTEYADLLCLPAWETLAIEAFAQSLQKLKWRRGLFKYLLPDSRLHKLSEKLGCRIKPWDAGYQYALSLASEPTALVPGKTERRRFRQWKKQPLNLIQVCELSDLDPVLDELSRLHNKSWNQRNKPGAFSDQQFLTFHQRLIQRCFEREHIALCTLANDKAVAVFYGFSYKGKLHYYQSGVDYKAALSSPGVLMHAAVIEWACNQGLDEYDFMCGRAESYKARLAPIKFPMQHLKLEKKGWFLDVVSRVKCL